MDQINIVDLLVLVMLSMAALGGLMRGVGTFVSFVGWVLNIQFTYQLEPYITPSISAKISSISISMFLSYSSLFIFFFFFFSLVNSFIVGLVSRFRHTHVDKVIGFIFGIIRGWFLLCLAFLSISKIFYVFGSSNSDAIFPDIMLSSKSYPFMVEGRQTIKYFFFDKIGGDSVVEGNNERDADKSKGSGMKDWGREGINDKKNSRQRDKDDNKSRGWDKQREKYSDDIESVRKLGKIAYGVYKDQK